MGTPIKTNNIPDSFWKWWENLKSEYPYCTIELKNGEIAICRVLIPAKSAEVVEGLEFGKLTSDSSGEFLERTFKPMYFSDKDEVKSV